jgi:alpha-amylase
MLTTGQTWQTPITGVSYNRNLSQGAREIAERSHTEVADSFQFSTTPASLPQEPPTVQPQQASRTWQDEVFYFPLTDRFSNGDKTNDIGVRLDKANGFHGGDLQGIINNLDYIKDLGATTLWLAPIQQNTYEAQFGSYHGYGFHGYWINDHEKVDPHQGDVKLAQELVKKAHEKGLKVVLDTVLNHTGPDHAWTKDSTKKEWFHHNGGIQDYDNQFQVENNDLGGLPDLNQSNPETYKYLVDNTEYWVKTLGVDGVRLDAIKHIDKQFWTTFVPDLKARVGDENFFVLGEVLNGDPGYVAEYQKAGVDHLFDIPLYYTLRDVFGNDASAKKLGERLAEDSKYPDPDKLVTLLDNHDFPRFMSTASGDMETRVNKLKLANTFMMAVRGTPSTYYGTETAMEGGDDPDNRRMMEFERRPDVKQSYTQVANIRANDECLRRGEQLEMWQDDQVYAFSRRLPDQETLCMFNTSAGDQSRTIPLRDGSPLKNGDVVRDQISGAEYTVKDGAVQVNLSARTGVLLKKV